MMRGRLYVSKAPQGLRLEMVKKLLATQLVPSICDLRLFISPGGRSEARNMSLVM